MARTKEIVHKFSDGWCEEFVDETFTHQQTLDDGRILYADPSASMWMFEGEPMARNTRPEEWDATKAVEKPHRKTHIREVDYS